MTLVDNQVTVVGDKVADLAIANEARDQRDIDLPRGFALAAADRADVAVEKWESYRRVFRMI